MRPARAFSIAENVAKSRLRVSIILSFQNFFQITTKWTFVARRKVMLIIMALRAELCRPVVHGSGINKAFAFKTLSFEVMLDPEACETSRLLQK